jgi:hypothetical protein
MWLQPDFVEHAIQGLRKAGMPIDEPAHDP